MSSTSFASLGDSLHIFSIINTCLFAVAVAKFSQRFDGEWAKQGFCVVNKDVPYLSSHDWCAYLDVMLAAACGIAFLLLRKEPGMSSANDLVKFNIPGIVGHGIGHFFIGQAMRDDILESGYNPTNAEVWADLSWREVIQVHAPLFLFWLCLIKAACAQLSLRTVAVMSLLAQAGNVSIPFQFQFTYVQTVLLIAFSVNQMSRPQDVKDFEYALYPAVVGIPLGFVGWLESTACSTSLVQTLYGHVMYDVYIPLSMLAFYAISYMRHKQEHAVPSVKKMQ